MKLPLKILGKLKKSPDRLINIDKVSDWLLGLARRCFFAILQVPLHRGKQEINGDRKYRFPATKLLIGLKKAAVLSCSAIGARYAHMD
jgi:hypothetical protein